MKKNRKIKIDIFLLYKKKSCATKKHCQDIKSKPKALAAHIHILNRIAILSVIEFEWVKCQVQLKILKRKFSSIYLDNIRLK